MRRVSWSCLGEKMKRLVLWVVLPFLVTKVALGADEAMSACLKSVYLGGAFSKAFMRRLDETDLWTAVLLRRVDGQLDKYEFNDYGKEFRSRWLLGTLSVPPPESEESLLSYLGQCLGKDLWSSVVSELATNSRGIDILLAEIRVADPLLFNDLRNARWRHRNSQWMDSMTAIPGEIRATVKSINSFKRTVAVSAGTIVILEILRHLL